MSKSSPHGSSDSEPSLRQGSSLRVAELDAASMRSKVASKLFGIDAEPVRIGAYTVLKRLGSGGMGIVYSAYDERLDRKVAIKVMRGPKENPHYARRLLREAQALAQLSHPNVVQVYEVGEFRGQVFIAMEHLSGQTLRRHDAKRSAGAEARKVKSLAQKLDPWLQAAKGLWAAHRAGLVHRDFKPDNVMVLEDGRVKVFDFGLSYFVQAPEDNVAASLLESAHDFAPGPASESSSKVVSGEISKLRSSLRPASASTGDPEASRPKQPGALDSYEHSSQAKTGRGDSRHGALTQTGITIGTPAYMAPEQLAGARGDTRSDQFSFCIAVWESLSGKRPYSGSNTEELAEQISNHQPALGDRSEIPLWLRRILSRGLSPAPEARYPSLQALIEDIEKQIRRRRSGRFMAAAMLPLVMAGGLFAYSATQGEDPCQDIAQSWAPLTQKIQSKIDQSKASSQSQSARRNSLGHLLDYVKQGSQRQTKNCQLAVREKRWNGEAYALQSSCFGSAKSSAGAFLDRLTAANRDPRRRTPWLARSLPPLESCDKIESKALPALDPALRSLREQAESKLAQAQVDADFRALKPALDKVNEVIEVARNHHLEALLARSLILRASTYSEHNDSIEKRKADLSLAYRLAEKVGNPGLRLHAATLRAALLRHSGDAKSSLEQLRDVQALAERSDVARWHRVRYFERACAIERYNGNTCKARQRCLDGLDILGTDDSKDLHLRSEIERRLAWIDYELGDINNALRRAERAQELRKKMLGEDSPFLAPTQLLVAALTAEKLRMEGSTEPKALDHAISLTKSAYDQRIAAHGKTSSRVLATAQTYAELLRRRGKLEQSEALFRQILSDIPNNTEHFKTRINLGHLLIQKGQPEEGQIMLKGVLVELDELVTQKKVDQASALYPARAEVLSLLAKSSHGPPALKYADEALRIYDLMRQEDEKKRKQESCGPSSPSLGRYEREHREVQEWRDKHTK